MKFGGLSEQEVKDISVILDAANVEFNVISDDNMIEYNKDSMQNDIRHLSSPSISTHVLAVELKDGILATLDADTKMKLLEFGITDEVPEGLGESPEDVEPIQKEITKGHVRILGMNLKHQLILIGIIVGIFFLYDLIFKAN